MNYLNRNGIKIGGDFPTFIIAELSANHNQDFDIAVETVKAAKEAGADAIKLQTYTADTITMIHFFASRLNLNFLRLFIKILSFHCFNIKNKLELICDLNMI